RLLVAVDDLWLDAEDLAYAVNEYVAVRGVAGGGCRDEARPLDPVLAAQLGVLPGHREGAREGVVVEAARAVDPLPEADDLERAHNVVQAAVLDVSDEETQRVGAAVKGGDARHKALLAVVLMDAILRARA